MIIAALSYAYMVVGVIRSGGVGLTFSTFILWASLAWITTVNLRVQKIDAKLVTVYAIGSSCTAISLLCLGRIGWSYFDTVVAMLVVTCIIIWKTGGPKLALIAMVTAGLIAAMPFTIMTWRHPETSPILANSGFFFANLFTYLSAKEFDDRLYSGVNVILCGLLVLFWISHVL
jgi:uncharacterized membrane protein YobD (UPF0266 family)